MTTIRTMVALLALTSLTACERTEEKQVKIERTGRSYQAAMTDVHAGRLDAAIEGFSKVLRADPSNSSARFQLACLLQDHKRDFAGAFVAYHEFLLQQPDGDRASVAKTRLSDCEHELAKALAAKFGLDSAVTFAKESEKLTNELKLARDRNVKLDGDLSAAMRRIATLRKENERLIAAIRDGSGESEAAPRHDVKDAKALLDEDDENDRIKVSDDIDALRREGADELSSSSILPQQAPDAKARRAAAEAADAARAAAAAAAVKEPLHERRPPTYVVQEGDTLTRIAIRFYGRPSAWALIRNANKAVISTDGRVQAGMKIVLPDPK